MVALLAMEDFEEDDAAPTILELAIVEPEDATPLILASVDAGSFGYGSLSDLSHSVRRFRD